MPQGLLGAVLSSSPFSAWAWLLPTAAATEFLTYHLIGGGLWGVNHSEMADVLLTLTTISESLIGGSIFRIWMRRRQAPPTEGVLAGLVVLVLAVTYGAVLRREIATRLLLDDRISIAGAWAASMLGAIVVAPLVLALAVNARGHAGRSDGSHRELLLALLTLLAISGYVFTTPTAPGNISIDYLVFPPLIWIAARFRPKITFATCVPLCTGIACLHASGFGQHSAEAGSLSLQIFLIMILAAALLVAITRHEYRQLELRLLKSSQRLYTAEDAGQLAAGILLHDGVGQTLTALSLSIRSALRLPRLDCALADKLDVCRQLALDAHQTTRRLLAELHPPGLKDLGLVSALESLVERIRSHDHLQVGFTCSGEIDPLPMRTRQLLYRGARDLLSNVVRHAQVDQAELSLRAIDGAIELEVRDQGVGWDAATWQSSYVSGMPGLFSLKGQVELLGGTVVVVSSPGQGCFVGVMLPPSAA
jgi:signal transduction histidine kinase